MEKKAALNIQQKIPPKKNNNNSRLALDYYSLTISANSAATSLILTRKILFCSSKNSLSFVNVVAFYDEKQWRISHKDTQLISKTKKVIYFYLLPIFHLFFFLYLHCFSRKGQCNFKKNQRKSFAQYLHVFKKIQTHWEIDCSGSSGMIHLSQYKTRTPTVCTLLYDLFLHKDRENSAILLNGIVSKWNFYFK